MFNRLSEVKDIDKLDILFLGSSHTYRGFDTRIFNKNGLKTFNLGSSAQSPIQTKALINRYLDRLEPKLVVFEVYPPTLSIDGVESSLDIISNDDNDLHSYQMAIEINKIRTYNTLLYATIRDVLNLDDAFSYPTKQGEDTYISGGYVEKEISYFKTQNYPNKEITLNNKQVSAFENILETLRHKEIEYILVYAPISKNLYSSYTNNKYYDSLMSSYGNYYNFNKIMRLNDSLHFYDPNHLNQLGVELFNNELITIINK